ncbi:MAG TPA: protein-glutamate O-methyltransferase CheR [Armatimonadota bacterium]|nr:protein-glutamate O-methyltransferase CheR [Armatimonadota bacterium]
MDMPQKSSELAARQLDADYEGFCRAVRTHTGLDLAAYKRNQMERRLRAMADRVGADSLLSYWKMICKDQKAVDQFLDRVTINVSELFRNPEKFEELRTIVLPALLREKKELAIWSAGCSYGAEAYSLRILLQQLSPRVNHRILATDIDTRILARAREGIFSEDDMRNIAPPLRHQFFTTTEGGYRVSAQLRQGVEFRHHDLLRDKFPEKMDLILCRNVVIYFADEAKRRLFEGFYQALRPGGYLLVGSTERIFGAQEIGFRTPRPFFYQKPSEK